MDKVVAVGSLLVVLSLTVGFRTGMNAAASADPPPAASDFGPPPEVSDRLVAAVSTDPAVPARDFGPPPTDRSPFRFDGGFDSSQPTIGSPTVPAGEPSPDDAGRAKRERFVALAREVADLASDAELDRLSADLDRLAGEKRAEAELRQAREALERVVAAFPDTAAADAAREMLDRRPAGDAPATPAPVEAPRR